jgi:phosphate transport system permease protein
MSAPSYATDPKRFEVAGLTLFIDRFMTVVIKVGGALVITAVLGIFVFIFVQIFPLFQAAKVKELQTVPLPDGAYGVLGVDEWGDKPFVIQKDGKLLTAEMNTGSVAEVPVTYEAPKIFTAIAYNEREQQLAMGTSDGFFTIVKMAYTAEEKNGHRQVSLAPTARPFTAIGTPGQPIQAIAYGDSGDRKLIAAVQEVEGQKQLHVLSLSRKRSLMGAGKEAVDQTFELSSKLTGRPVQVLVPTAADSVIVLNEDGSVNYLFRAAPDKFEVRQTFRPFEDSADPSVSVMNFLLGDVSIVFANVIGQNRVWSLYIPEGQNKRLFGMRHDFPKLPAAPSFISPSARNKAFLIGGGDIASLRYSTTDTVRWQGELKLVPKMAVINGKYNRVVFLDAQNKLHLYELNDPHPEAGWRAIFDKLYYEGSTQKKWEWQSTGGSDDFEPKLSLMPLIFGTFKGTLYAMIFAVPIAILAALYTSQFMDPDFRQIIKPTMEIMASLPSVVLGFLAAIYIAPLIETRVPSLLLVVTGVPLAALLIGWGWSCLPITFRKHIKPGYEAFVFIPVLVLLIVFFWNLGPLFERMAFVITDAQGQRVADFRYWWPQVTGASFEQRNSLVVGFVMGFAVIPIIFTITDDALSNVPPALKSASLALGASRWQTAMRIVVPTASAGIFSAVMIGLGRAVGETMIVVMATGNTPVMEWNIFSGMRTLSANIAVELPEAPQFSTLYRMLFLGALALFILTFAVNTVAEVMRQHLREKYKTI